MVERVMQANAPSEPRIQHSVRKHELPSPGTNVELDHVDPDLTGRVERRERVRRRDRAGSPVSDPLATVHCS